MAHVIEKTVSFVPHEGGENMAESYEFEPDPYLTALGMSIDEQKAYDAWCDAVCDASEEEMRRTGITYTLDEVFEHMDAQWERLKRDYPRENWGQPCSQ